MTSPARLAVLAQFTFLVAVPAFSATIRVPADQPTIQAGIAAATAGDTVLVRPGTYNESLVWANKDLVLQGDGVADSVVITTNSTARVLLLGPGVTRQSVLQSLTIREGKAETGAGLRLVSAAPVIQRCRFEANVAARQDGFSVGGAIYIDASSSPLVLDCAFIENRSDGSWPPNIDWPGLAGAIFVKTPASLEARRCLFRDNVAFGFEGGAGGAIMVESPGAPGIPRASALIDSCTFDHNFGYGGGVLSGGDVAVSHCAFLRNDAYSGAAFYSSYGTYSVEHSLFYDNSAWGGEGGTITAVGPGSILNNTIAFNLGPYNYAEVDAPEALISRNIICNNEGWSLGCSYPPGSITCNDVWGNELDGQPSNYHPGCDATGTNGNISLDPLFCSPDNRDLTLNRSSPCAPAPGCGILGALGVGCGIAGIAENDESLPVSLRVLSPQPILSGADIRIGVELPEGTKCRLAVYSVAGRCMAVLNEGELTRGHYEFLWSTSSGRVPSGVYYAVFSNTVWRVSRTLVVF